MPIDTYCNGLLSSCLKNIVLTGFGHITILDLDTIDLSNLNRQFLFKKKDVKQSKALIAAQTAAPFNPNVRLHPIHGNIKEPQFDIEWFEGFDIVLNALDNLEARRHVNKMCMAAKVPLVESGTAGYLGQVQPLLKASPASISHASTVINALAGSHRMLRLHPQTHAQTFPTCTIRSTPSQPIHCIVWAKSYLLGFVHKALSSPSYPRFNLVHSSQLFGEDEDAEGELDDAEKQGENVQEIATLRKEAQAFKAVRTALRTSAATGDAARMVFQKVYNADIRNLLSMSDMWRSRAPPLPLDFDTIQNGTFVLREPEPAAAPIANGAPKANGSSATEKVLASTAPVPPRPAGLKAQRSLTLAENLALFDDEDTLDFVTAAANLRGFAYGIERKTPWEVKEMAGNIIPAIATTNAIVSGLIVLQALHPRSTCDPRCGVCSDTYAKVLCDPARVTLRTVVEGILGAGGGDRTGGREVGVYEDKRVLSDPDWDDNMERTLESLNVTRGKFLTIVDEDGAWGTIAIGLGVLPPNHPVDAPAFILPSPLPLPPRKERRATPPPPCDPATSKKRNAPDDDEIIEVEPSSKRAKTNGNGPSAPALTSPSKKRRLEEDGLLLMDSITDQLRDDVIEID
ncbi:hypothetical protein FIBSPDRAFT_967619 [Athelia psychrophila]|uniref:THIF-type NAD/FAD binding fold domain-containing protein n=1 Tax=Athelia psychrophila TaxID=1759441 RepID=A0A167VIX1_9AGAM|nr:hypothetical protein FIBSPDRAFT_967619 [Fibularhizoctonia sp. CBS 109695]